ncbi:MAG: hypothetical protein Q8P21_01755 [bacterium]|nr:hypothetical protein [bacterium]
MGAEDIQDKELEDLDIKIDGRTKENYRLLKVPEEKLSQYIELVKLKMTIGFWNEVVGVDKIVFIFKFKDGSIKEYNLSPENEWEIDKLCAEFNDETPLEITNVYRWLADNKFYHDFMMEHYADLINRQA